MCNGVIRGLDRPYPQDQTFAQITNRNRKDYLQKYRELDEFKTEIETMDRKISKTTEIIQVLNLIVTTVTEIVIRFRASVDSDNCDMSIPKEISEIVKYANQCLTRIGVTYATSKKTKVFCFADDLASSLKNAFT
jgi:hypothetical protein